MEKNDVDYSEYKYKSFIWHEDYKEDIRKKKKRKEKEQTKKQKNKKLDKEGLFVVIVMFLCFSMTIILSEFLNNGGTLTLLSHDDEYFQKYYFLSLENAENDSTIRISADELANVGGAGYIYYDNKYYLIASAYESKDDAETVEKRLKSSDTTVLEITLCTPNLSWVYSDDNEVILGALEYIKITTSSLINIGNSLEKEDISKGGAISQISTLYNEIKYLTANFDKLSKYKNKSEYIKMSAEITVTLAMLENLISDGTNDDNLLSKIRFTTVTIIVGAKKMLENI